MRPDDWEEGRRPQVPARRPATFVAPDKQPIVRRMEVLPPSDAELTPALPVQTSQRLVTSHVDRAKGFSIETVPLAAVVGFVATLAAVGLFSVPLLSGAALVVLFGVFAAVWLVGWIWHQSASPDGVALWQVIMHYRLLREEQKARLRRMERDDDRR